MSDTLYLHTIDTEAYEAALDAAEKSLRTNGLSSPDLFAKLAEEDGVVGHAARRILGLSNEEWE